MMRLFDFDKLCPRVRDVCVCVGGGGEGGAIIRGRRFFSRAAITTSQ